MQTPTSLRSGTKGDALVLLHGIGGCAKVWQPQLDAFASSFQVIAWNMPGYGGSQILPEMTFPALAEALDRLLTTIDAGRVHLVGHSMGGMVVQEFLRKRANRVTSVCLYSTSPGLAQPETPEAAAVAEKRAREFMERRIGPLDRGLTMRDMAASLLDQLLARDAPATARIAAIESISSVPPDVYRQAMRCILSFDGTAIVPTITTPTLVLAGGEDRTMEPPVCEAMARQIPGARYVVVPRVGHLANIEDPPGFNHALLDFLADV